MFSEKEGKVMAIIEACYRGKTKKIEN